jgi:hypothetical protein
MSQEFNYPEADNSAGPVRAGGLSDDQISQILSSLPRERASVDFTDQVVARVARSNAEPARTVSAGRLSSLATLMFGPRPGFGMLLASSAAMALVAGLGWSQFFGAASQNAESATTVAQSEATPASSRAAAATSGSPSNSAVAVRGTRVGTNSGGTGFDRSAMPNGYPGDGRSVPNPEGDRLRADYQRLQRQLMLLRQLQDTQSPVIEIGSNGDVHYVIDLSDYMKGEGAQVEPPQF